MLLRHSRMLAGLRMSTLLDLDDLLRWHWWLKMQLRRLLHRLTLEARLRLKRHVDMDGRFNCLGGGLTMRGIALFELYVPTHHNLHLPEVSL